MSTIELRLRELRESVAIAADVSVEPKAIPDWWKRLSENGRRNYLVKHPKSKYRHAEVMDVIKDLDDKQRGQLARFLTKLTGPKGQLTQAADKAITPEAVAKIPPKDKEKIADLLRAAHGDESAKAKVKGEGNRLKKVRDTFKVSDYFDKERQPKNKLARTVADQLEKKHGRPASYGELKNGLREALAERNKNKPKGNNGPDGEPTEEEIKWWKAKTDEQRDEYMHKWPKSRFGKVKLDPAPAPDPKDNPATGAKPGNPDAPGKPKPKGKPGRDERRGEEQEHGYRAVALTLASLGLLVVGGAALVAAGVPVSVFTPELAKFVWRDLPEGLSGKKNEELVSNLASAIKSKFAKGNTNKELEDALVANNDEPKEDDGKGGGINPKRIPQPAGTKMPIRVRPFRPVPDKVRKPYSPARARFGKMPTRR